MQDKIKEIIANILDIAMDLIDENSSPETIEKWDSLKHMNIIIALEEEFNIEFSDEDMLEMLNYQLIILTIKDKLDA